MVEDGELTEKQNETADLLRAKKDMTFFMNTYLRFSPRVDQAPIITALQEGARRILINKGRRWGGSKITSAIAITLCSQIPGLKCGVFSPGWDETEVWMDHFNALIETSNIRASLIKDDKMFKKFSNGSLVRGRVLSRTAQGKRGRGYDLVIFTEAAFIADDEMHIVRLSKLDNPNAIEILESSPNGLNHFYKAHEDKDFISFDRPTHMNPLVSPKELAKERSMMTELQARQELDAEFIDDSTAPFPQALIDMATKTSKIERYWTHCEDRTGVYVAGLDLGRKRDKSQLYVWKIEKDGNLQGVMRHQFDYNPEDPRFWTKVIDHTEYMAKDFRFTNLAVDCTGLGDKVVIDMQNQFAEHKIYTRVEGFNFTYASKNKWEGLINQFSLFFERYKLHFPFDLEFVKQLKSIRFSSEKRLFEAIGKSPDIVMAAALGVMCAPKHSGMFYSKANEPIKPTEEVNKTNITTSYGGL